VQATDVTGATGMTGGCTIVISGTFVINAISMNNQTNVPDGPQSGLEFVIADTNPSVPVIAPENTAGKYTLSGVTNGLQLTLLPSDTYFLVTSTGAITSPIITVELSGTSGSTTIYVQSPRGVSG